MALFTSSGRSDCHIHKCPNELHQGSKWTPFFLSWYGSFGQVCRWQSQHSGPNTCTKTSSVYQEVSVCIQMNCEAVCSWWECDETLTRPSCCIQLRCALWLARAACFQLAFPLLVYFQGFGCKFPANWFISPSHQLIWTNVNSALWTPNRNRWKNAIMSVFALWFGPNGANDRCESVCRMMTDAQKLPAIVKTSMSAAFQKWLIQVRAGQTRDLKWPLTGVPLPFRLNPSMHLLPTESPRS